ncbi:MAG: hypothetical protein Q9228_002099 [Teloschistes exilis]
MGKGKRKRKKPTPVDEPLAARTQPHAPAKELIAPLTVTLTLSNGLAYNYVHLTSAAERLDAAELLQADSNADTVKVMYNDIMPLLRTLHEYDAAKFIEVRRGFKDGSDIAEVGELYENIKTGAALMSQIQRLPET